MNQEIQERFARPMGIGCEEVPNFSEPEAVDQPQSTIEASIMHRLRNRAVAALTAGAVALSGSLASSAEYPAASQAKPVKAEIKNSLDTPNPLTHSIINNPVPAMGALQQQWVDDSLIPTAPVEIDITPENCGDAAACTVYQNDHFTIITADTSYLWSEPYQETTNIEDYRLATELNFRHELGHVRDFTMPRHYYRQAFKKIMGIKVVGPGRLTRSYYPWQLGWENGQEVIPLEQFAMAYSYCSKYPTLPEDIIENVYWGYGFTATEHQYLEVCDMMKHLGSYRPPRVSKHKPHSDSSIAHDGYSRFTRRPSSRMGSL